jgi:hypothetical protein
MRCQYHSNKPCNDCDKHLVICRYCNHIDSEGDCDNSDSKYYGECMDGVTVCCCLYKEKE